MKSTLANQIRAAFAAEPDLTAAQVAARVHTTPGTVRFYCSMLKISRQRPRNSYGKTTKDILELLRYDERLTMREIAEVLGLSSTSVVRHHLLKLREAGIITYEDKKARSIRILK